MSSNDTIRNIPVRALQDCECITHHMTKGKEYHLQSDHAQDLADRGLVELRPEPSRAVRKTDGAEKRG